MIPYLVLGLNHKSNDQEIRQKYLELVRAHPPSRDPEKFQQIQDAYDQIKERRDRVREYLLGSDQYDSFSAFLRALEAASPEPEPEFVGLQELINEETAGS